NLLNLNKILKCFYLASGLKINLHKSQILEVGSHRDIVQQGALIIGCEVMRTPFNYLGVPVGDHMTRISAWDNVLQKSHDCLSNWKSKTLSIGGRLTLLKSVLGATPLYTMSIYKAPKRVLLMLETIRSKFFYGADSSKKKITWIAWEKVLASKKHGGLGVASLYALNRALLLKWVWRFLSQDGSLWSSVIKDIYGPTLDSHAVNFTSHWCFILREVKVLSSKGFNFLSHCKRHGEPSLDSSFRRPIRGGVEQQQWSELLSFTGTMSFSFLPDRWVCDSNGDGVFSVKDIRSRIDDLLLPSVGFETRWVKFIPIKVNVFVWRARLDRLPTRCNLSDKGVPLNSMLCNLCGLENKDSPHVFFRCELAKLISRKVCRWWDLSWNDASSFVDWFTWFSSIRLPAKLKLMLEGVFYVAWWHIWVKENQAKDKIGSRPNKNGKHGGAGKSQKQLQSKEKEKLNEIQVEGPKLQTPTMLFKKEEKKD
nr:RNA-directed DNA polymerase, eukaryota, reverse transcriptase zinc-binding domain protein [Tanacetum cinerariifolium]